MCCARKSMSSIYNKFYRACDRHYRDCYRNISVQQGRRHHRFITMRLKCFIKCEQTIVSDTNIILMTSCKFKNRFFFIYYNLLHSVT